MGFETTNVASTVGQGVTQPNAMQTVGQFAAIQNALNQNRLFQAQTAAGQARLGAINPQTGAYDPSAANAAIAGDPRTALVAGDALAANQQYATGAQSLAAAKMGAIQGRLGPLMTDPNVSAAAFANNIGILSYTGVFSKDMAATIAGNLPSDPKQLRGYLASTFGLAALGPQGALAATVSKPAIANTGSALQPIAAPPQITADTLGGAQDGAAPPVTPAAPSTAALTLSPGEKASGVTVVGPDNITRRVPLGSFVTATGDQAPGVTPPQTALAPGVSEAAAAAGTGAALQLTGDRQAASTAQTRILALQKALTGIQGSTTGPTSQEVNNVKSALLSLAPTAAQALGIDPSKIKNYDEANKYLTQYAAGTASAYGPGTDAKLATAASGNASTHISNLAAQDVIKVSIGLERMKQAQVAAFEAAGEPGGPGGYGSWAAHWSQSVDPRAFMLDIMPKADRVKMLHGITTDAGKRAMINGKRAAEEAGQFGAADIPQ